MDPLDPEYSFKFLTGGAPIKIEKVLDIEVKPDSLKTTAIVTAMAATVVAGAAAAYYWFKKPDGDDDDPDIDIEDDEESGDTIITTMTTTTTTTSYLTPQQQHQSIGASSSSSSVTTRLPLQPPKPSSATTNPLRLTDDTGTPLPLDEQNKLIMTENKLLKKDLDNLNNWVNDQMMNFEDRLHRLEANNIKRVRDLESDLDKERYCGICQEHEKQVCWSSCGHRLCARCAIVIKSTLNPICPHCRTQVDSFVKCYNT
ncbi:RING/leucine zipper protein [Heterostelium album PN500]|uniref:RING/leucine zipper protein n=1 Tax=Heterostelium pallidum (strain ATCC 26659 / Pp 5 / PN500) TaxID=670386 RepID=D3B001_HETP5|nr:RING/leucine zipper protein [Heterostelium album PN500]EFA84625.1 RING/leucine zipper protein [Heterostelium album PN500]|eukprot:XP_020436738.1 RING/leucine zipper protein [Heterostelium album PN500]